MPYSVGMNSENSKEYTIKMKLKVKDASQSGSITITLFEELEPALNPILLNCLIRKNK